MTKVNRRASYIYIAGCGRSGSTLLELLLGRHSKMSPTGELEKFSLQISRGKQRGLCSCGQSLLDCSLWRQVIQTVNMKYSLNLANDPFAFRVSHIGLEEDVGKQDLLNVDRTVGWQVLAHRFIYRYYKLLRLCALHDTFLLKHFSSLSLFHKRWAQNRLFIANSIRNATGTYAIIDSSKDSIGCLDMYSVLNGEMRIIFLTRDARGVVWSNLKRSSKSMKKVQVCAHRWLKTNNEVYNMLEKLPSSDFLHVRYEDLCAHPRAMLKKICEFSGFEYEDSMANLSQRDWHTLGGNKIRNSPIDNIKQNYEWKHNLTLQDIDCIDIITGQCMKKMGYKL